MGDFLNITADGAEHDLSFKRDPASHEPGSPGVVTGTVRATSATLRLRGADGQIIEHTIGDAEITITGIDRGAQVVPKPHIGGPS